MKRLSILALAVASLTGYSMAGLSVSTFNTALVADLDSTIPGVYRFAGNPTTNGPVIGEPNNWAMTGESGRFGFDSRSWHMTNSSHAWDRFSTPFTSDINNNGNTDDRFDFHQEGIVLSPAGGAGNYAFRFDQDRWQDRVFSLKAVNNTGTSVSDWAVTLDTWFNDTGLSPATMKIFYSATWSQNNPGGEGPGAGFTLLDSRNATNANAGLSTLETIGGNFSTLVPAGGSLFIKIHYDQNGQGTEWIIDNLSVTAIPEPGILALFAGLPLLILRKRSR